MHRPRAIFLTFFPALFAFAFHFHARDARAEGVAHRVHLVLPPEAAGAGCDPAVFSSALETRVTALAPSWRELHLEAHVTKRGAVLEGRVWATSDLGAGGARRVIGVTCDATLRSMALLAAIALDSMWREREDARAREREPVASEAALVAPPEPEPPSRSPVLLDAVEIAPAVARPESRFQGTPTTAWRPLAGLNVEVSSLGTFGAAFAGIERRHGAWPLAVRLGAMFGGGDVDPNIPEMHTQSSWRAGRIEGCPWQLEITSKLYARPCLGVDVGAVRTELINPSAPPPGAPAGPSTNARSAFWVAPRLTLRLGFDVFSWLRVEAAGTVAGGTATPEWVFDRGFVMNSPGPIMALATGAAVRFP